MQARWREHGYYFLPFLLDGALLARVDLKTDRRAGALAVVATHVEPAAGEHLAGELRLMSSWLGLSEVVDLAPLRLNG